ncbi:RCC1 domain-containing protein [Bdellovibrio reynosensis]|uniref:Uncharacterized protein n=1 Tax=Bdellovibrio reynosensis TaxID=2835041 RepID=A0ABY4C5R5_9BACT|nr:hypothetical protein [Bdellovibrio reynosensis]UOF00169.1 hypothetical protein MNR06_10695 [Bdellovibrio reynosensis]
MGLFWFLLLLLALTTSCTTKNDLSLIFSDSNTPTFSLSLNNQQKYTANVAITAAVESEKEISEMAVHVGASCIDVWEPYAGSKALTLSNLEGEQFVSAKVRTVEGFESECVKQSIFLDKSGPTISGSLTLKATRSLLDVSPILNPPTISDSLSGVSKYEIKLVKTAGNVVLKNWTEKSKDQMFFDGLTLTDSDADTYFYMLKVTDNVGNVSEEKTSPTFIAGPIVTIIAGPAGDAFNTQNGMANFKVALSRSTTAEVTVGLKAISGSAIAGINFFFPDIVPQEIKIAPGATDAMGYFSILSSWIPGAVNNEDKSFELEVVNTANAISTLPKKTFTLRNTNRNLLGDLPKVPATGYKAVTGAKGHMCGLTTANKLECWGGNVYDNGKTVNQPLPSEVTGAVNISKLGDGYSYHTCYVNTLGDLYCFGTNSVGELGNNTTTSSAVPLKHPTLTNVKKVTTGINFTCVIDSNDKVQCWGLNTSGQVGKPNTTSAYLTPQLNTHITKAIDLYAGYGLVCAIDETAPGNRTVKCWGKNDSNAFSDTPTSITGIPSDIQSLSVQGSFSSNTRHGCGLTSAQRIFCWGSNYLYRRGTAASTAWSAANEVLLGGGVKATKIIAGPDSSCALGNDTYVYCWGHSIPSTSDNELVNTYVARKLTTLGGNITDIEVTEILSCATDTDTKLKCWGNNLYGEAATGVNGAVYRNISFPVGDLSVKYTQLASGFMSTCALREDKTVNCWGNNSDGQLGNGTRNNLLKPVTTLSISNIKKIVGLSFNYCALGENGRVYCWGANKTAQTGNGLSDGNEVLTPTEIPVTYAGNNAGLTAAIDVTVGYLHACAVQSDGVAKCWGNNADYQTSGTDNTLYYIYPQAVPLTSVETIAAGAAATCAVKVNVAVKEVYCWGSDSNGIVGSGASTRIPRLIASITTTKAVKLYVGYESACYIHDGETKCWGTRTANKSLPLNVAVNTVVNTPTVVPELAGATEMSLSFYSGCATLSTTVKCWGADISGLASSNPTVLNVPTNSYPWSYGVATSITIGSPLDVNMPVHACGITNLGDLKCWGMSLSGEGHDAFILKSPTPVMKQ